MSDLDSDDGDNSNQSSVTGRDKFISADSTKLLASSGGNIFSKTMTQVKVKRNTTRKASAQNASPA